MRWQNLLARFRQQPNTYVAILALVGLLLVFLVPPFQSPDEQTHFYRGYQISEGHIFAKHLSYGAGDELPASLSKSFEQYYYLLFAPDKKMQPDILSSSLRAPLDTHNEVETRFENTAIYPPVAYIPQAIGIGIGRIFSASPVILLYLARIANLTAWLVLLWLCMRRDPRIASPVFAFALLPIVAFQAASASADVMTTAVAIAFTLEVFRLAITSKQQLAWRKLYVLLGLGLALSLCKFPYAVLALLVFILPGRLFISKSQAWLMKLAVTATAGLPALVWFIHSQKTFVNLRQEANSAAQLHHVLTEPISYLGTLFNTYIDLPSDGLYIQMIGHLGWLDTKLPFWILLFGSFAVFLAIIAAPLARLNARQRLWTAVVSLSAVGLISTALYLTWNVPGAAIIDGLQGRYYLPLFGLLIMLGGGYLGLNQKQHVKAARLVYVITGISILTTIAILFLRYYSL